MKVQINFADNGKGIFFYMKRTYFIVALFLSTILFITADGQSTPKLVKSFGMLPGTFAGTIGADLSGKFVTDSLGTLLISDGTDTGTHSVMSFYRISAMIVTNSKLFLIACDSLIHGNELWISDGTTAGTHLVKEINPTDSASGAYYFGFNDYSLITLNNKVFFYGSDGVHGVELWRSDGTDTGTVMVKDINTTPVSDILDFATFQLGGLQVANDRLFFAANDGIHGPELWCTDGTEANTYMVKDLVAGPAGSNPQYLTALGNKMCFWTRAGADTGLYITDGSDTGTHLLVSHIFTPNSEHAVMNNKLYFFADSLDVLYSSSLWVTDGTPAGTMWLDHAFYAINEYSYYSYICSFLHVYNNQLYFGAADHLWKSNGTAGGSHEVTDFSSDPGLCCTPTQILNFDGKMYMRVKDFSGRVEIVSSDGTDTGIQIVACPTADFTTGSSFVIQNDLMAPITMVGTKLFFWNTYETALGHSLYKIDLLDESVNNITTDNEVKIYPNPTEEAVTIETAVNDKINRLEVYDLTGKLLSAITVSKQNMVSLQLPGNRATMMLVKVYTANGVYIKKIISE